MFGKVYFVLYNSRIIWFSIKKSGLPFLLDSYKVDYVFFNRI